LRVEHPVADYAAGKPAFDADPIGRARSGVRRYRVMRAGDDPGYVLIDLESRTPPMRLACSRRCEMWARVSVMHDPQVRLVELVEATESAA